MNKLARKYAGTLRIRFSFEWLFRSLRLTIYHRTMNNVVTLTYKTLVSQSMGDMLQMRYILTEPVLGRDDLWPILLALIVIPCTVSLVVLPCFPESPRYLLVNKGLNKEAEKGKFLFIYRLLLFLLLRRYYCCTRYQCLRRTAIQLIVTAKRVTRWSAIAVRNLKSNYRRQDVYTNVSCRQAEKFSLSSA